MKSFYKSTIVILAIFSAIGFINIASATNLGTANDFAIISSSTITNTGASIINGNVGLNPGSSITGFQFATLRGTQYIKNTTAIQAQSDIVTAYNSIVETNSTLAASTLGGTTKTAGTYNSASGTFEITGTLTLDAQNDANATFVFKAASTLVTAPNSKIVLINGAQACNIFWQVGSSATLGTNSIFKGNLLALTSVTVNTGTNVEGRIFAQNGAVTLDTNIINSPVCSKTVISVVPATINNTSNINITNNTATNNCSGDCLLTRIKLLQIIRLLQSRK
ncbi:MAG: ice-binding family protein [Candidatus Paceibacterota bacterium]|jgi:hypothetical protein|nr:ice-binding family protein [bacterium]